MTLPKIKHVRAWFIGGATAEQGAGGGDYHDQGANHWIDDHIATPMSQARTCLIFGRVMMFSL